MASPVVDTEKQGARMIQASTDIKKVLEDTYARQPRWLTSGSTPPEQAEALLCLIEEERARTVLELGTASGFSAAVLARALAGGDQPWRLHTVDFGERCYFDETKYVGQAFDEVFGPDERAVFHRSSTSLDLPRLLGSEVIDLAYIDASHSSPWAAVDLLGMLKNLKPGAIVALDDIRLPFVPGYEMQNAGRDLFRTWRGEKWTVESAPNLGILRVNGFGQALADIASNLQYDWDEDLPDDTLARILALLQSFDGIDYQGKEAARLFLTRSTAQIDHPNSYLQVSDRPFARPTTLHPNDDGTDPAVCWANAPLEGVKRLRFDARAFNPHANNPGAELSVAVESGTKSARGQVRLKPNQPGFIEVATPGFRDSKITVTIGSVEGNALYAGVRLLPITII